MTDRVKVQVTVTGSYVLPADLELRQDVYRTTDPAECLLVNARNTPAALLGKCDGVETRLELVPDDDEICVCGYPWRYHVVDSGVIRPNPWSDDECEGFVLAGQPGPAHEED